MNAPDGKTYLQAMQETSLLNGGNNVFVEGLYEDYLNDAGSVPASWRALFDSGKHPVRGGMWRTAPYAAFFCNPTVPLTRLRPRLPAPPK